MCGALGTYHIDRSGAWGGDMPIGIDSQHIALAPADKGDQPGTAWRKGVRDRWTEGGHEHKLSY